MTGSVSALRIPLESGKEIVVSSLIIIGSQWGDEGKGKIVDMLSQQADVVARYQGGSNAGHTVVHGDKQYILHLIPSGILHPNCQCLIGNGVVVDPEAVTGEITELEGMGFDVRERLMISDCAHLVLPYNRLLDVAQEKVRGKGKIGTTGRGIGCAYSDKVNRIGLRMGDLRSESRIRTKLRALADFYEPLFEKVFDVEAPDQDAVTAKLMECAEILGPMLTDGPAWLNERMRQGAKVLIEGAQGVLLDIDHGTYPFVTSSNPTSGGACTGLGIGPKHLGSIAGVAKAYTTRVGEGPMPTEFDSDFADIIRKEGGEFGATTGRPRRCGWFDAPVVRRAIMVCGIEQIMLTKLDVLDKLEHIAIGAKYKINGEETDIFPSDLAADDEVEVVYEQMPGWQEKTSDCKKFEDLPQKAQDYVHRLEELLSTPVSVISVSPDRDGTILRQKDFFV